MKKNSSLKTYRRILTYVVPYRKRLFWAMVCMGLVSFCAVIPPWLMKNVVDDVLIKGDSLMLNLVALSLVGVFLVKAVASYGQKYLMTWVGQKVVLDLRLQAFDASQRMSFKYVNRHRVGELISRVTNDATVLQNTVTGAVVDLVVQGITVSAMLGFLLYINWRLTLATLCVLPPTIAVMNWASRKLRLVGHDIQASLAALSAMAEEALSAIRIVRAFATEKAEKRRFERESMANFRSLMRGTKISALLSGAVEVLLISALSWIFWLGGRSVAEGKMSPGELIAFLGYLGFMAHPVTVLTRVISQLQHGLASAERIFGLLDSRDVIVMAENPVKLSPLKGEVSFKDVWFRYDEKWVLKGINLKISPGETVAIVGYTGSGKSTMADLVQRFYDPEKGLITIDGFDLKTLDLTTLRRQIGVVPQDPVLMKGSFRYNIAYGLDKKTDEDIFKAAEIAGISDFIWSQKDGLDQEIGERGVTLSGGQRQRVAIARAIIRDPRILIMDEATSSLDAQVEQAIQRAMERAMEGRTAIVIAHRLSTIRGADRILFLKDGIIEEEGSPEELLKAGGLYSRMEALQRGNG